MPMLCRYALLTTLALALPCRAEWSVTPAGAVTLDGSALPAATFAEMSGIGHFSGSRYYVVQDSGAQVIGIDVTFAAGSLTQAQAAEVYPLSSSLDYEGIAAGLSEPLLFVSEEGGPGVLEINRDTGQQVRSLTIPAVFANRRGNRGFESLDRVGDVLWTANEEALTVDGPVATTSAGSTVRLLKLDAVSGEPLAQYAYNVEPIHTSGFSSQSGLSDLLIAPDGRLITLERSFAGLANPAYLSRIYEVDLTGATDISQAAFDSGLIGQTYTPASKRLLWSGSIGAAGQNLEGLALGPQAADGSWDLLGVVDDGAGGDPYSGNTVVGFRLAPSTPQVEGDYNGDGQVDTADYDTWRRAYGLSYTAGQGADGNGDGVVNAADYAVWRDALTATESAAHGQAPEPTAAVLALMVTGVGLMKPRS
ncbi:hypothetical protein Pla123a_00210 [Posidoniimonas polymericola]|uniref:Phytase-like domain-containing protein n=1 Tax=Posidoniimonas polymericola TaxID=2528002 RepID=A0A5C5ZDH0_9BACT|nr:esterase-like activity of phytase family protein [Posidoniimonas polymericola]TWT85215.1 hypothetical protein Pla123a_00210 [Posidoniimonas polymericola]